VRLVYLDEAGLSKPSEEPFLVVAGAIVHADHKLTAIERHLDGLAARNIRGELLDGFVFHAHELFNGGGKVFKREKNDFIGPIEWTRERRWSLADELAKIPAKFDLPIAISFLDKEDFANNYGVRNPQSAEETLVLQHSIAFPQTSMMIEQWMRANTCNEVCMLIAEDNDRARRMIRGSQNFYQDPNKVATLRNHGTPEVAMHVPFRKIKEDPLFQPKKRAHPMIIADFCAYVFKKVLMKDERYYRFFAPWRKNITSFDLAALKERYERRAQRRRHSAPQDPPFVLRQA
jgi:Protein of unknown function (DUF3800)